MVLRTWITGDKRPTSKYYTYYFQRSKATTSRFTLSKKELELPPPA